MFLRPSDTGKTAFAEILAQALDLELIAHSASALLSAAYPGGSEHVTFIPG